CGGSTHGRFPALAVAAGVLLADRPARPGAVPDRVAGVAAAAAGRHHRERGVRLPRRVADAAGARAARSPRLSVARAWTNPTRLRANATANPSSACCAGTSPDAGTC